MCFDWYVSSTPYPRQRGSKPQVDVLTGKAE